MNVKERSNLPRRTVFDPCPDCKQSVSGISALPVYAISNPYAVIDGVTYLDERSVVNVEIKLCPCMHVFTEYVLRMAEWKVVEYL